MPKFLGGKIMKYLRKKGPNVCNLFSNGQGEKDFIYRDKTDVAKCIQLINSDRIYKY